MNEDDLKKLWQQQTLRAPPSATRLVSAMQNRTPLLRRWLDPRDFGELMFSVFVIITFGYSVFTIGTLLSSLGCLIVIGSAIFRVWEQIQTRRANQPAPPGSTIVESLRAELNSVRGDLRLSRSAWLWLIPSLGLVIATWGMPMNLHAKIPMTLLLLSLYAVFHFFNRWVQSKQVRPLEAQLQSLLHSAETGEPLNLTQTAHLRPIALGVAMADQVEPAEFKVAFWSLAWISEIAFIVLWFVWMFVLENNRNLVWIVPFILAGLLFSWSVQKMTERAVGISILGVHLQKGRTLILWEEIKEVRAFRTLNFRSLRLISESGEKTIMPWTSLERHSDLKAAIEGFAPANHPIREYLSLLKQN